MSTEQKRLAMYSATRLSALLIACSLFGAFIATPNTALAQAASTITPSAATLSPATLSPATQRYTPNIIRADLDTLAAQARALSASKDVALKTTNTYIWHKSQRWLDVAQDEYRNNNRGAVPAFSLQQSQQLLAQLNTEQAVPLVQVFDTPLLLDAARIRPDLWAKVDVIKSTSIKPNDEYALPAQCALADTAYTEVQLTWAAWVQASYGWRSALPYIANAEKGLARAQTNFQRCVLAKDNAVALNVPANSVLVIQTVNEPAAAPASAPAAKPAAPSSSPAQAQGQAQALAMPNLPDIVLPSRAYFARNSSKLSLDGTASLTSLAQLLASYPSITLRLEGYADDTGSGVRNSTLSLARAKAAQQVLVRAGVASSRIALVGLGAVRADTDKATTKLKSKSNSKSKSKSNDYNRRVQLIVSPAGLGAAELAVLSRIAPNQTVPAQNLR